jgi:hypothetical protein
LRQWVFAFAAAAPASERRSVLTKMVEKLKSQEWEKKIGLLMLFAEVCLQRREQFRLNIIVDKDGPNPRFRVKWLLDYCDGVLLRSNDDKDRLLLDDLWAELSSPGCGHEENYVAAVKDWHDRIELLREFLAPEYRLECVSISDTFENAEGVLSNAYPEVTQT